MDECEMDDAVGLLGSGGEDIVISDCTEDDLMALRTELRGGSLVSSEGEDRVPSFGE